MPTKNKSNMFIIVKRNTIKFQPKTFGEETLF